jgi:hypothetical protein
MRWAKRLAPATAALAVVLVAALALAVASGTHTADSPAGGSPAAATGARPAGGAPKYYAEIEGNFDGSLPPGAISIVVRATATGAVVAKIPRPVVIGAPKLKPINVAAAADDRTFYVLFDTDTFTANDEYLVYRFQITPLVQDNTSALSVATISVATGKVTSSLYLERSGRWDTPTCTPTAPANTSCSGPSAHQPRQVTGSSTTGPITRSHPYSRLNLRTPGFR